VLDLARREFSYIKDSPAHVEVVLGDGRLSLEREPDQRFDVLVMDAFSGDSVPVHLVTREAFALYFRHLAPGGILAVNTSNRHLDLTPVMERNAAWFRKIALQYDFEVDEEDDLEEACLDASWTLIVDPSIRERRPSLFYSGRPIPPHPEFRMWTDDFSNLYGILK
jgi:spermidine synthase